MKKVRKYILKYWYAYVVVYSAMIIGIVLDMLYPMIAKVMVDDVIRGSRLELLSKLLIAIILIGIGRAIAGYIKEFTVDVVSAKISSHLRKDLFNHIQNLSMDYFEETNTGKLMARIKDDVDGMWNVTGYVGMMIVEIIFHISIAVYCMFRINKVLVWLPFCVMLFMGTIAILMEKKLDKVYGEISEENAELTTIAEENLTGVRTVKAFAREEYEIEKFVKHNKKYYELNMKQSGVLVKYYPVFQVASKLLPLVVIIVGGIMVSKKMMTLGALVAFTEYSRNVITPLENLGWVSNEISSGIAACKKIDKIYKEKSTIIQRKNPVILDDIKGKIEFENVSFKRDNQVILDEISFSIGEGKTLGIMGATGTGKTTIINLLERFFDTSKGTIKVDGVDIKDMDVQQLRSSIGTVMQDVFLFSDTIEENIKMGQKDIIDDRTMEEASMIANAGEFISKMPLKYKTIIGEKGVGLSGGQKQRISIARALAKNNPILVLDDATSALDMDTEHAIQEALDTIDATKIIIGHRISAVSRADEIIVLEDGKIKERGTHKQLLKKRGLYYDTYKTQYGTVVA